ncbi:hypothetical protein DK847_01015 [Aestuariivirga litoralis]|uniref:Lectin-like protein BA14k n=1 Tax=Aestuariivirga litoralis TaxID=2650924 RepID=A0A2W2ATA2_9HYPH|nr:BA14K family protein [Aestuariivirga litoralis]PZF78431.1 hypothetical protein DK847_01015 [Aestuariivirga litoralis]
MLKHTIIALAAMGAGLAGFGATGASAMPVSPSPAIEAGNSSLLTEARTKYNRNRVYNRHYHGRRCGNWSNTCRYRHGGYYYENPWWILPMVGAGIAIGAANSGYGYGYGSRHVEWCLDRYRSYNPRTNTWVAYSGRVHQCISPYGP